MVLYMCCIHLISVPTPCLECVHASVCEFMSTWLPMSAAPLCIAWWKHEHPLVASCFCHNHFLSGHTPWLECVHASVHVYRSTWLQKCSPPPLHSYMESWVLLYITVYVLQSPHFCSNTLFRMCTCISACIYVHMPPHVSSTPYG